MCDLLAERRYAFELEIALEMMLVQEEHETEHAIRVAYEAGRVHL